MTDQSTNLLLAEALCQHPDRFSLWLSVISRLRPETVLELGVWRGEFAQHVLRGCPSINAYYMLDPWRHLESWNKPWNVDEDEFGKVFAEAMERTDFAADRRKILRGTTTEVIAEIENDSVDLAYVDGDHTLRGIAIDLTLAYSKVKPGGILCGDDYTTSLWQHDETFEPSLVCPFAAYFAEAQGTQLIILPHSQFAMIKPQLRSTFAIIDTTGNYGPPVLLPHVRPRPPAQNE